MDHDTPLGNRQVQGFRQWLIDAELCERNNTLTPFGEAVINYGDAADLRLWQILWASLSYNSPLINWYAYSIPNGEYTKKDLTQMLALIRGNGESNRTDTNAITSLINTLKTTPLGETLGFGQILREGRKSIIIKSVDGEKFSPIALISAIGLYSRAHQITEIPIPSLLSPNPLSPCRLFQIQDDKFPALCQTASREYPEYLSCFIHGESEYLRINPKTTLENIFLRLSTS